MADPRTSRVTISRTSWGEVDGRPVELFSLANGHGLTARITNFGATVVELHVPDRHGVPGDVVLGFESLAGYVETPRYFGATVGRVGNRIADAHFELDGRSYELAANHGRNHLHGGRKGWDHVVWTAEPIEGPTGPALELRYVSADGEEGYPGRVEATTRYTLTDGDELAIEMTATTDRTTIVNMVHHGYFNLGTGDRGVLDHELQLFAGAYTPGMPPDGRAVPVAGTPFDFTRSKAIGRDLAAAGSSGAGAPPGFDSNWIVDGVPDQLRPVAHVADLATGRAMTLRANQPGVQFYSGVFLDGSTSGKGRTHLRYGALCLETQAFPNAINVPAWRDQVVLEPGAVYRHEMAYGFTAE